MYNNLIVNTGDAETRAAVARNPECPTKLLGQLAQDRSIAVRGAAASNHSSLPAALARLAADHTQAVRAGALTNPNCPDHVKVITTLSGRS